jgi:translation initiation factor IF-2
LTEEERSEYEEERFKIKEQLRNEDIKMFPIMIKSSTAGSLETLLKEAKKLLKGMYRIEIIETGVGPVTEGDINLAA